MTSTPPYFGEPPTTTTILVTVFCRSRHVLHHDLPSAETLPTYFPNGNFLRNAVISPPHPHYHRTHAHSSDHRARCFVVRPSATCLLLFTLKHSKVGLMGCPARPFPPFTRYGRISSGYEQAGVLIFHALLWLPFFVRFFPGLGGPVTTTGRVLLSSFCCTLSLGIGRERTARRLHDVGAGGSASEENRSGVLECCTYYHHVALFLCSVQACSFPWTDKSVVCLSCRCRDSEELSSRLALEKRCSNESILVIETRMLDDGSLMLLIGCTVPPEAPLSGPPEAPWIVKRTLPDV